MNLRNFLGVLGVIGVLMMLSACTAAQNPATVNNDAPGFLLGIWHGFIFPFSFVASLFTPTIDVYAVPNNGNLYNLGYFIGIVVLGVGAGSSKKRRS